MARRANTNCSSCGKAIYRRPNELVRFRQSYCSRACQKAPNPSKARIGVTCSYCNTSFEIPLYLKKRRKFCSVSCSNKARRGIAYSSGVGNKNAYRLATLLHVSGSDSCMVEGCDYTRTLDVHRLLPGSQGGAYVLGNMFAICPNHHAEVHRGLISFEKNGDFSLKSVESGSVNQLEKYGIEKFGESTR